jgi:hypothetical protein
MAERVSSQLPQSSNKSIQEGKVQDRKCNKTLLFPCDHPWLIESAAGKLLQSKLIQSPIQNPTYLLHLLFFDPPDLGAAAAGREGVWTCGGGAGAPPSVGIPGLEPILLLIICLDTKEMPIIISQLGVLPNPHMTYPKGIRRLNLASHPSNGWTAPSYSG